MKIVNQYSCAGNKCLWTKDAEQWEQAYDAQGAIKEYLAAKQVGTVSLRANFSQL